MPSSKVFASCIVLLLSSMSAAFQAPIQPRVSRTILNLSVDEETDNNQQKSSLTSRRNILIQSIAAAGVPLVSSADELKLESYVDSDYNFKLSVPSAFTNTAQQLSGRRKAVFFTDENSKDSSGNIDTLGFIAYTPMRDDFTSLGSFGSIDQVAQSTILPKSELAGNKEDSKMLSAESKNNAYYFDYVAKPIVPTDPGSSASKSGQMTKELEQVHFRTIFTLLPLKNSNVAGLTLVTITFQTTEAKYNDMKPLFDEIISSFGKA